MKTVPPILVLGCVWTLLSGAVGCASTSDHVQTSEAKIGVLSFDSDAVQGATSERCQALVPLATAMGKKAEVDATLLLAVMAVESNFTPAARSRAGASGLMQIMPKTGRGLGCGDLFDPAENVRCGAELLRRLLVKTKGDLVYALAAYNAGSGRVLKAQRAKRLPKNFRYVERVLTAHESLRQHGCEGRGRRKR